MDNENTTERAKLDFSFDDTPTQAKKDEISRKVEEISEQAGFKSRVSPKSVPEPEVSTNETARVDRRARTRTGRTYPFNTKIKPETYDVITAISDKMTQEEGRYVSLAEVIEKAIELLENKR
jgi:hypothetical protein